MRYRKEIDGLRALAVMPVILFHAGFQPFAGGFVGVDVFFVISGYLITTVILEEKQAGSFSLRRFYERRARRILPALLLVAVVCIPVAHALFFPADLMEFSQTLMATMLFVSNIYFWRSAGYFETPGELRPLLHTWSLAVEEQFYILFPFLLLFIWWRFRSAMPWILAALAIASLLLAQWGSIAKPSPTFFLLPTRAWELLLGGVLAHYHLAGRPLEKSWATEIAAWLGLGVIIYSIFAFDQSIPYPSFHTLVPTLGALLILAFAQADTLVGRLLGNRILVGIGLVSYSAYLWHHPVFAFARHLSLAELSAWHFVGLIALAFVLSYLSWRLVETPFRRKQAVSSGLFATLAISVSLACLAIGYYGHMTEGQGFRSPEWIARATAIEARLRQNYIVDDICDIFRQPGAACLNEPEILLWGDSNARQLAPGLALSRPGLRIAQMASSSCGPFLGLAPIDVRFGKDWSRGCIATNDRAIDFVRAHPSVKYVVLGSAFDQYLRDGVMVMTREEDIRHGKEVALLYMLKTVEVLKSVGVVPVVFSPMPQAGRDLGRCLSRAMAMQETLETCNFSRAVNEREQAHILPFLRELQARGVKVVFLSDLLCDTGICRTALDGIPLYRDHIHFTRDGSAAAGRKWNFYELIRR